MNEPGRYEQQEQQFQRSEISGRQTVDLGKDCNRIGVIGVIALFIFLDTLRFLAPTPLSSLETTYDVHLELIGKRVVDFLLVLIELFSLNVTAKALRANISSK